MSKLAPVTLETDGSRDFACLPNGVRYILGTTSVLRLVADLVPDRVMKRRALEEFNRTGRTLVVLDVEKMFQLLAPKPLRRSSVVSSLIRSQERDSLTSMEGKNMSDIAKILNTRLAHLENTVREMNARVASGNRVPAALHRNLHEAAISMPDYGDQSKNQAYYGLGEPKVDTMEDPGAWTPPAEVTHPLGKTAAALKANSDLAEKVLSDLAETSDKIDTLKTAGRRFNASKAQSDVHRLASQVHELLANADLAEGWVGTDLTKLAKQAAHIHGLFAKAR